MSEQWQKVKEILQSALEFPSDRRKQFLDEVCGDDESLRREVETLLLSAENADGFMEQAAIGKVAEMFVGTEENSLQMAEFLNHYRILSNLGAGGMGEVYLAEDTKLNRFVALKLLPPSKSADEDANRFLLCEARFAAALDHPHICHIHEIAETDGRFFIVMQFCEGETLAEKFKKEIPELRETLDWAIQIANALDYAHSHRIIHRDIKPANIIVNQSGQTKILDFGLAQIIAERRDVEGEAETAKMFTADSLIIGTAPYMSPEQMRGKPLDARTDIFSFGAMLYEMLSGKQVFKHESQAETIAAVLHFEPPITKTLANAPLELQRIVRKCLAKNKEERYRTAKDLLIDLQNVRQELDFQNKLERIAEPHSEAKTEILDVAEITDKRPSAEITTSRSKNRRLGFIIGAIVLLFAVAGFGYWFFANRVANTKQIESIAVMPFVNESGNEDIEYLSDGMTEMLISSLLNIPKLNVKARSSVFHYKGKDTNAQTVGKELNVQAILNGRVVQRGQDLTLYIELVDTQTENSLWKQTYNKTMTNLVALQNDIARDVADKLRVKLSGADEQKLAKNYTENVEAYQLYLKGRYHVFKLTPPEVNKGISYFQQAIAIDPNYALAYAGLSDAYLSLALGGEIAPTELFPKAKAAANRAIEIDDQLAEAHSALGNVLFFYDWDFKEAENQIKRALELNPKGTDIRLSYATILSNTGRHAEGLAEARRARELEPLNLRTGVLEALFLIYAGQADEGLTKLQKVLELEPNFYLAHLFAASAYIEKGMFREAAGEARRAHEISRGIKHPLSILGYALAKSGNQREARAVLEDLLKLSKERYISSYDIAMIYNGLDERDETLAWLERGLEKRDVRMALLKVEPKWNNLRDDPRFQELLRKVGFPQ